MPVSIRIVSSSNYYWAEAHDTWTAPSADSAWNDYGILNYALDVDETLGVGDEAAFAAEAELEEAIAIEDASAVTASKRLGENLAVSGGAGKLIGKTLAEALPFALSHARGPGVELVEDLDLDDASARSINKVPIEAFALADSFSRSAEFGLAFTQSVAFNLQDSAAAETDFELADSLSLADSFRLAIGKGAVEPLVIGEGLSFDLASILNEALGVSDAKSGRGAAIPFADAFALSDDQVSEIGLKPQEELRLEETFRRIVGFVRRIDETLTILDEKSKRELLMQIEAALSFAEARANDVTVAPVEPLRVSEAMMRQTEFQRHIAETLTLIERDERVLDKQVAELMRLVDVYLRSGGLVASNLRVGAGALGRTAFEELLANDAEAGYAPFRQFMPGDYELRYALVRYILEARTSDRPRITKLRHIVDVPDIGDRGEVSVPEGELVSVTFSRQFTEPPEVGLAVKGGTIIGMPRIVGSIRVDGFDLEVVDSAGNRVAGEVRVSYVAHGY